MKRWDPPLPDGLDPIERDRRLTARRRAHMAALAPPQRAAARCSMNGRHKHECADCGAWVQNVERAGRERCPWSPGPRDCGRPFRRFGRPDLIYSTGWTASRTAG